MLCEFVIHVINFYVRTEYQREKESMIRNPLFSLALFIFSGSMFAQFNLQQDSSSVNDRQTMDTVSAVASIPIFSTSGDDADLDIDNQDVSALLQSSRDVFTQMASFQFGVARYRMRGLPLENQHILINGVSLNNLENGFTSWSSWGGLNDVTRFVENRVGNVNSRYGFSGAGGYTNIDSKASSFKKGSRFTYSLANRIYRHRLMFTHATGMLENGWALTFSASNRYGNEVYIPGTFFNASSFYLSLDKHLNTKHLFSFTGFVAPVQQGRAAYATKETLELAGTHYYNPNWGYQNGNVRNAAVSSNVRPVLMLSHIFNLEEHARLTTSIVYNFGKNSLTGLQWNSPKNPKPDFYRNLPSYYYDRAETELGDQTTAAWLNDMNTRQLHWDKMISVNQNNFYTLPSETGQNANTTETRAVYVLENRVEDLKNFGFNTVFNKRINRLFVSAGMNANRYKNRKYKVMEDLLGATYWIDHDRFGSMLGIDPVYMQNDIENPDRKVKVGDVFGYDYAINVNRAELWGQAEYNFGNFELYEAVTLSHSSIWREGFMANGKFPNDSKGLSDKLNFLNYGIKAGAVYKINGRHFITANGTVLNRPPDVANSFLSPRVRNTAVGNISNEKVFSGDINYMIKYPALKMRLTYFNTQINNQTWLRTYWDDNFNNTVNLIMKGMNQSYKGVEFGIEKNLLIAHTVQGAFSYGQYIYSNRPTLEAWQDNNNAALYQGRTAYLENYKIGSTPQVVAGVGYRYTAKKYWSIGINVNYFDQIYVEPNPDRRTKEAIDKYVSSEKEHYIQVVQQQKLPNYYTINLNGGKSFRINRKYFLNLNVSINNLTNNKNNIVSGFEQLRWDSGNINKFDNKYMYMQGISFMLNMNFSF